MISLDFFGGDSESETPVPIPNTEVKPFSADGTAVETLLESRTLPVLIEGRSLSWAAFFCGGYQEWGRFVFGLKGWGGCGSMFLVGMDGVD